MTNDTHSNSRPDRCLALTTTFVITLAVLATFRSSARAENPVEVGTVHWQRDYDTAIALSRESKKPIFLLFQEVPGCSGCKQFGKDVLSHPKVVKAIENEFVPLLVHNNQPGKDATILKKFKEPAWNFQVVRFLNAKGEDLIRRKDRVWEVEPLSKRMVEALEKAGRPVPAYLRNLTGDTSSKRLSTVAFATHCFWVGEMELGAINGVELTEAGFFDGREVTLVSFDPSQLTLDKLLDEASKRKISSRVYVESPDELKIAEQHDNYRAATLTEAYRKAPESDQKRQLRGTAVASLDLSPPQATKVNAWIRKDPQVAMSYLTPTQRERLKR